jgi:hypothetical protein
VVLILDAAPLVFLTAIFAICEPSKLRAIGNKVAENVSVFFYG